MLKNNARAAEIQITLSEVQTFCPDCTLEEKRIKILLALYLCNFKPAQLYLMLTEADIANLLLGANKDNYPQWIAALFLEVRKQAKLEAQPVFFSQQKRSLNVMLSRAKRLTLTVKNQVEKILALKENESKARAQRQAR